MIRRISIFTCFFCFYTFSSCKNEIIDHKLEYNQKANELIQQVISDHDCGFIMEIPKESTFVTYFEDNPGYDIRKKLTEKLSVKNKSELDSLVKLTKNFVLDSSFLKQKNIKIIKREVLKEMIKKSNPLLTSTKGILGISKPIFNKNYTIGAIYTGPAFTCAGPFLLFYKYQKGKWQIE